MKLMKIFVLAAAAGLAAVPARAALTAAGVAALDGSGNSRTTFTNTETIALRQIVSNSVASDSMIQFIFTVYNPSGGAVLRHEGNSARATLGNSNSQLSGVAIARFYSVPGVYKFRAEARLGVDTVIQEASFQISSPNINLIYPPNGARGLTDKPLTFRWVASGASTYKVTVGEGPGLYPLKHQGNSASGMYSYPENLDETEKLSMDPSLYYWKVEGLDAAGTKIAESNAYSFSLKSESASQSKNVAVTSLELIGGGTDLTQEMQFMVVVQNTGGQSVTNVALKMTLGGLPSPESPKDITMLMAGAKENRSFKAFMPPGQEEGLAVACVDVFDDNIPDNCKTKLISRGAGQGAVEGTKETRKLSYQEMWEEIIRRLGPDAARALDGYTFDSIECTNCTEGELNAVMLALINGEASLSGAAIADPVQGTAAALAASAEGSAALPDEEKELDLELAPAEKGKDQEWSGFTTAVKSATPFFYTVKGKRAWQKVWETLSSEEAPKVDFGEKTIVGIIAGADNKADSVRIIARRQLGEVTVFDYYMTEATGPTPAVPYVFKTYDLVEGKAEFNRIDVGGK
ncbi:MAG: hypothetical protein A2X32_02150 [Elusimicrobia bacterium GWC2_64_44]|nr:MAG: hypothetical protein A2X32_02150 [Elusimicrobia bacterium GWC2_64_44]